MRHSRRDIDGRPTVQYEIEDVILRFAKASDEGLWDLVPGLLADDVALEVPAHGITYGPGPAALLAYLRKTVEARASQRERGRHLVTNIVVDMSGSQVATASSYATFIVTSAEGATNIRGFCCYDDQFHKIAGSWRLAHRSISFDRDALAEL